jgi:hypothetical protein
MSVYIVEVSNPYSTEELIDRFEVPVEQLAPRIESETGILPMEARMAALSVLGGHRYVHEDPETHLTVEAWRVEASGAVV